MKRNLILAVICILCALLLIGCGANSTPTATSAPAEPPVTEETPLPSNTPTPVAPAASFPPAAKLPDASLTKDTHVEEENDSEKIFEIAEKYVDKPVSELIAAIGEPKSSAYAGFSCLIPGGDDGELYYDGFVVSTVKSGDSETVINVSKEAHISP